MASEGKVYTPATEEDGMGRGRAIAALALFACAGILGAQGTGGGAPGAAAAASVAASGAEEQALLTAVGTLTGANAYTTYMALGSAADSWASKVYPADKALRVVLTLRTLARSAADGLDALLDASYLHPQDRAYVRGMLAAYGFLVAQADGFEAWVKTGERGQFDRARDQAWEAITRTLMADGGPRGEEEEALE